MSTRSVIARSTGAGTWEGRYVHSDGYPSGVGKTLYDAFHGHFQQDAAAMLKFLVDDHPAGWSDIVGADFSLPAQGMRDYNWSTDAHPKLPDGSTDYSVFNPHGPLCLCHSAKPDSKAEAEPWLMTQADAPEDREWLYVIHELSGNMHIYRRHFTYDKRTEEESCDWLLTESVNFFQPEPDWSEIQCGKELEHCGHYAYYHFPELKGTVMERMGTREFLGIDPAGRELHNAIAFEFKGKRYLSNGGQAGNNFKGERVWWASLAVDPAPTVAPTDYSYRRHSNQMCVARYNAKGEPKPYRGVTWVFPPNLRDAPIEVFAEIRRAQQTSGDAGSTPQTGPLPEMPNLVLQLAEGRRFRERPE